MVESYLLHFGEATTLRLRDGIIVVGCSEGAPPAELLRWFGQHQSFKLTRYEGNYFWFSREAPGLLDELAKLLTDLEAGYQTVNDIAAEMFAEKKQADKLRGLEEAGFYY